MHTSALQKTVWALITTALTFFLAVTANAFLAYRLNEVKTWTLHTHLVIEELKDAQLCLQELESEDRAWAISGNPLFMRDYPEQRRSVLTHLDNIATLVSDNPRQVPLIRRARLAANAKLVFVDEVFRAVDAAAAQRLINSGRGTVPMQDFKSQIEAMTANEQALLRQREEQLIAVQRASWFSTAFLGFFSVVLLVWVFNITRQALAEEQKRVAVLEEEVAERKRVEQNLLRTSQKLASSNTDLQQFAYVASHDLQEPLRAVAGFLTLIVSKHKDNLDPETEGWINHAVEGAQRMRSLINDLLSYARVESQGKTLNNVDVNLALQRARQDLVVLLEETGAELIVDDLPQVVGDEGQLAQLFQNLIGNALKFRGEARPRIVVKVEARQGEWLFSIQDNGIGFDPEHAKRIFVIFQRLHGRDEYKGTGIGLALCKKIIERHGGRIWAESQPGAGATFFFTLPIEAGGLITREPAAQPQSQS